MIGEIKDIILYQLKMLNLTFSWVNVFEILIIASFLLLLYQKFINKHSYKNLKDTQLVYIYVSRL